MAVDSENESDNVPSGIGDGVRRREDRPLLTGDARYTDDISYPDQTHLAIYRSQHAHATIESIDTTEAESMDGVCGVYTFDEVRDSGAPGLLATAGEDYATTVDRPMLASGTVRYQGEPIAAVVAEDRYTAHEALDAITVAYDRLDSIVDPVAAREDEAPTIHDETPDNTPVDWEHGDKAATDDAFDDADHVVSLELVNQRLAPTPMEPRAVIASHERSTGVLRIEMSSQAPHYHQQYIGTALGIPTRKIRVISPDVGGGFGGKAHPYHEEAITAWCANQLDRPVKWQATRSEDFASMHHGRGHVTDAELAVDDDGTVRALRAETHVSLGAYLSKTTARLPTRTFARMLSGQYRMEAVHCHVYGVWTNAVPTDAYRGAGRPEAVYVVERLMDATARKLDMNPVEFRRQNFIPAEAFPYEVPTGHVYDSGDYEGTLEKALDAVDLDELRERQGALRSDGRYLGIGVSCYVEGCGTGPGRFEAGQIRFDREGNVEVKTGTHDHGQGHETTFAQVVSDRLGIPIEDVTVVEGDTARVPEGNGTYGSRSMPVGGNALVKSTEKIIERGRRIAAYEFEAAREDVVFDDGEFFIEGSPDRSLSMQAIATRAYTGGHLPEDVEPGLEAISFWEPESYTFPFGTHVVVLEVDARTGEIEIERYVAVDDVGNQINPLIVEGQVHGGVAQGIGQALFEEAHYDDSGTLLSGTLQDYTVPKSFQVPTIETHDTVTPSPRNPLGVKGVGESGTIAAPPAIVNAVVDALEPFGVEHIDMPLRNERVWNAIHGEDGGD